MSKTLKCEHTVRVKGGSQKCEARATFESTTERGTYPMCTTHAREVVVAFFETRVEFSMKPLPEPPRCEMPICKQAAEYKIGTVQPNTDKKACESHIGFAMFASGARTPGEFRWVSVL